MEQTTAQPTAETPAPPDFAAFEAAENAKALGQEPPPVQGAEPADTDDEPAAEPVAPVAASAASAASPEKPISKRQQQINDLIRAREESNQRAAESDRRAAALEAKIAALEGRASAPPNAEPVKPEHAKAAAPSTDVPKPRMKDFAAEVGRKYDSYEEAEDAFQDARDAWREQQGGGQQPDVLRKTVSEILTEERELARFTDAIQASQERGRQAYADFGELLKGPAANVALGRTQDEAIERVAFIAQHPQSEHIQYAILKDAALAQRLQQSDPYTFGMTIAGLVPPASVHRAPGSDTFSALTSASASAGPAAKTVPTAPAPPTTLSARSADPADPVAAAVARGDFSAFEEAENRKALAAAR